MIDIEKQHKAIVDELKAVRGDIRTMGDKQDKVNDRFDEHIKVDAAFQAKAEPIIDWINNLITGGKLADKVLRYLFYIIVTVLTIIFGFRKL